MEASLAKGVAKQYFKSTKDRVSKNLELGKPQKSKSEKQKPKRKQNARPSLEKEETKEKVFVS